VRELLLRRLSVALGYLPSWHSPQLRMVVRQVSTLPPLKISGASHESDGSTMLWRLIRKLLRAAPLLDLYPVLPRLGTAAPGKSYHFGSSFPHSDAQRDGMTSDRLGRVAPWRRIHLVDGSVLPTLPAATFTMSGMANAHRIATESAGELL